MLTDDKLETSIRDFCRYFNCESFDLIFSAIESMLFCSLSTSGISWIKVLYSCKVIVFHCVSDSYPSYSSRNMLASSSVPSDWHVIEASLRLFPCELKHLKRVLK